MFFNRFCFSSCETCNSLIIRVQRIKSEHVVAGFFSAAYSVDVASPYPNISAVQGSGFINSNPYLIVAVCAVFNQNKHMLTGVDVIYNF